MIHYILHWLLALNQPYNLLGRFDCHFLDISMFCSMVLVAETTIVEVAVIQSKYT